MGSHSSRERRGFEGGVTPSSLENRSCAIHCAGCRGWKIRPGSASYLGRRNKLRNNRKEAEDRCLRMKLVRGPLGCIPLDVFACLDQGKVAANHVLIVVRLPGKP